MTTPLAAKWSNGLAWRARGASGGLSLVASPTFALMAWIAVIDPHRITMCSPASGMPPIDGMAWMYLLMSVFHLSPWLKLVFR
jgi:hypothetical protein